MKKFIITSPKFNGEIGVVYAAPEDGSKLQFIDFMKCDLTEDQFSYFKTKLPSLYREDLSAAFGKSDLTIMESGYRVSFDQFWDRYNNKKNRLRAEKQWNKLSEADQANAFFKFYLYDRYCKLNPWYNKALPETYLGDRFWESEWK